MGRKRLKLGITLISVASAIGISGAASLATAASPAAQGKSASVPGLKGIKGLTTAEISRWKRLVAEARAEGQLVVVGAEVSGGLIQGYWNAFTSEFGINVTTAGGSPTAISSRILAERQQGVHAEDVIMAGDGAMGRILNGGGFQPLKPNVLLPQLLNRSTGWYYNKFPWCSIDPTQQYCTQINFTPGQNVVKFYYNTQLVTKKDLAKIHSWNDLLNPKWRGKVVMQNVAQGADQNDMQLGWALLGKKYWSKFMSVLKPTVLDGNDVAAVNGLARGQWAFAFFLGDTTPYTLAQQQGLPVAFFTRILSPGALPDLGQDVGLMAQAPHQAAAELYLNWAMSPEGQAAWNEYCTTTGNAALLKAAPKGNIPGQTWLSVLHTKRIYVEADHTSDLTNALAWWTQEMAQLGIH